MKAVTPIIFVILSISCVVKSQSDMFHRHTLTGGAVQEFGDVAGHCLFGPCGIDSKQAIDFSLGLTQIYQDNIDGGLKTTHEDGRYTLSYDLGVEMNLEKMLSLSGSAFIMHAEGSAPTAEGISESAVGDRMGVNGDAGGRRTIDLSEVFWLQEVNDKFSFLLGKMDTSATLDTNAYANDETIQFLSSALVNNPQIPIDYAIAAQFFYNPSKEISIAASVADSQGDMRTTGLDTAFDGSFDYVYVLEAGYHPEISGLAGSYRFGVWFDTSEKDSDSYYEQTRTDHDTGYYVSFDQQLYLEEDPEQGLGAFFRYGLADSEFNEIEHFVSFGMQYHGLIPDRDHDSLGLGMALGDTVQYFDDFDDEVPGGCESIYELYYSINICPWAQITPAVQFVNNPRGARNVPDATVIALRSQIAF